jgi:hypothetical protein
MAETINRLLDLKNSYRVDTVGVRVGRGRGREEWRSDNRILRVVAILYENALVDVIDPASVSKRAKK